MGRRSALSMKMVLPTVSWVAVMRLLKKAPSGILGIDAASKAFLGCSSLPDTPSLRYTDAYLGGRPAGVRRPKPALLGCASRPLTDSFRVHHVVNQEALQLVLDGRPSNFSDDIFYEPFELCDEPLNCSFDMIIRDGDRLLHDVDVCNGAASASVMSTCSSRLSNCTAGSSSTTFSAARTTFSRRSVDSEEGHSYSTASSASFQVTRGQHPVQCSCCSSPISFCHRENLCAGIGYSGDTDSMSESANSCDDRCEIGRACAHGVQDACHAHDANGDHEHAGDRHGMVAPDACHAYDHDHHDAMHDDDDDGNMVEETCYSEDPLVDFEESIEELVMCHQLIGQPDQLHALYCRYIQLNPPTLHPTIALAFFHTLQRLA